MSSEFVNALKSLIDLEGVEGALQAIDAMFQLDIDMCSPIVDLYNNIEAEIGYAEQG